MNEEKRVRYEAISEKITQLAGGRENIVGLAHCATRLRLVLADNEKADIKAMEEVDLVKGVFVAGDQVQIIFGTGLVNDVCEVMGELNHMNTMSLGDLKTKAGQKMNPLQKALKALSDVFIEIMPGILAAALLTGLSSVLGNLPAVESNETLYGIVRLINISSGAIFGFLPLCVAYSTVKRFGGRPIMGIVIGCIMLSNSLADAYAAAQGTVDVTTLHIFGFNVELVGFQGGIIVALLIGIVIAKLDQFFEKKVPEMIRLLVSPLLTILISSFLLFLLIGPIGRGLASGITAGLVWMTKNLGIVGYVVFSGVQQLIVITGLHHVFGAIETQLLVDTGRNFLNPLMSVAIIAQGGAVLGYMVRNLKNAKAKELCIPSFVSVLFGITEPALFGVNIRYRYPLAGGCIGGAVGGAIVYLTNLAALGFGTTVVPGIALADPTNHGYVNYVIAHLVALGVGFIATVIMGTVFEKKNSKIDSITAGNIGSANKNSDEKVISFEQKTEEQNDGVITAYANGELTEIEKVNDETFASKVLGDGIAIIPEDGNVYAPVDGEISVAIESGHAVGFTDMNGTVYLIHIGIDTVQLNGKYFKVNVQVGDQIKRGDLLVSFDKEKVEKAGFDTACMLIVTEANGKTLNKTKERKVKVGEEVAILENND
ncbi:PTS beta-glucoside transporter subunit IIBCA [Anaerobutyricum hallii]|jgi:PTS system sucrose-specific IIC component|uniref:PTS beta-glucoside transporter subunit IIBCA n=1 Tax=Anaerobutyricum hallii TaxID=39488 RepID=A0A414B496_9FIRM|nr:PTS transporter subunit IIBCA [Anaerobutyricum hallii]RHC63015.1 PTS beta-glucoside transporter subunit IIBCA [Anaerobutyricum hallii]